MDTDGTDKKHIRLPGRIPANLAFGSAGFLSVVHPCSSVV
jgi:hypothetical protein